MRKLVFLIKEQKEAPKVIEFITDRSPEWTIEQYGRNRLPLEMELIKDEESEEEIQISREVELGLYNIVGWVGPSHRKEDDREGKKKF